MTITFDLETNNLYYECSTTHCGVCYVTEEDKYYSFTSRPMKDSDGSIEDMLILLSKATVLIGHNIIGYDLPVLKKLYNWIPTEGCRLLDTLIISKLSNPNLILGDSKRKTIPPKLKGRHSLSAWGYRLGILKGDYGQQDNAWDKLTEDMLSYCVQDVKVTVKLFARFVQRGLPPGKALDLEHKFATIIVRQEHYGWLLDVDKAQKLHIQLLQEADEAEAKLFSVFTPLQDWVPLNEAPKFTKGGELNKNHQKQVLKGAHYNDDMEWGHYSEIVFNPGSRQHIARWLKEVYGWSATEFTEKGSIIINEKVLEALEFPEGKILAHYFNVRKIIGMVAEGNNAWLKMIKADGRIHGSIDTLGAVTRRCTHSKPNVAQVPSGKSYMGTECRSLFIVGKGKKLVGCDADGLELRTLSHYMAKYDGGSYARTVDEGDKDKGTDIHTVNQKGAGLPTRDDAKTFIYAFLYGAGDGKIGEIVNGTSKDGKRLKEKFLSQIPAIKQLSDGVQAALKERGTLKALDGNPYYIRSSHSALNTLLQGCGALVMKYWLIEADRVLALTYSNSTTSSTPQYEWVGNIHDEGQLECDEEIAKDVASICEKAFDTITEELEFRIPLRGTADIGQSWSDTH